MYEKKDIYIIKNDINSKVYIGQSNNVKIRFQSHCKPSSAYKEHEPIARAIQKYGRKHFWYEILEKDVKNYNEREEYYIKLYNSLVPNGYNIQKGGENPPHMPGENHPNSNLTSEMVSKLTFELQHTNVPVSVLYKKYGFSSHGGVLDFNNGKTYHRDYIDYPIRKNLFIGKLNKEKVDEIIKLLQTTYLSYEEIGEKYGVEARSISRINRGILHKQPNLEYPIRLGECKRNIRLTYDQVTEIIEKLQTTDISLRKLAQEYNCEFRVIMNIKNGTSKLYRRKGLTYPLRPNN